MADPILKFPPEHKGDPSAPGRSKLAGEPRRRLMAGLRRYRRFLLLVVLPLVAVVAGLTVYLNGGRYVGTDDAYVGAQKVLITPDVSGKIVSVSVKEGQLVVPGDTLFQIDPVPYRLALAQARAKLEDAKTNHANLVANVKLYSQTLEIVGAGIAIKQRDVERKSSLVKNNVGSQLDLDNTMTALVTAQAQQQLVRQQRSNALTQLLGNPDLPLEEFPAYLQAKAALDDAQRNLDLTTVRAPINGTATQVEQIQLGRYVTAGTPVFSVMDVANPWVDANPKESDLTYVAVGQPVSLQVDAFPNHVFKGKIGSLSPGTGAQFAILPPQNATGNFVKVVQRVPVRIYFEENDKQVRKLKAGMSVYATIDTGHKRTLAGLLGLSATANQHED
ncbi:MULTISPECIES: HlyD family secretion protein [unclassified Bradyrhizobium]|jgi:membrane fusion protein (multidrug efflux system)|uniref:HlyD family secretion protein n=1 Tax=unclassified Bradyrhizobium TaxID=2631580 RepID=UPI00070C6F30|nr:MULTISPECIES: HlyD family secretion protein [unclassified Bradyrhizobium]KQT03121.1 transporter [Bradyrhizobium sp. Leaf396]